jgi:hypothetical protein
VVTLIVHRRSVAIASRRLLSCKKPVKALKITSVFNAFHISRPSVPFFTHTHTNSEEIFFVYRFFLQMVSGSHVVVVQRCYEKLGG